MNSPSLEIVLGPSTAVLPGSGRAFIVEGLVIAVFRTVDGALHATQDRCPHAGSTLADGMLGTTNIICAKHGWKFNLKTGVCANEPGCRLRVYPVREEDGQILVRVA